MKPKDRTLTWWANKFLFIGELEEFLSHCPNMVGEDDMRDICKGRCILYEYCISIEPSSDCLGGTKTEVEE